MRSADHNEEYRPAIALSAGTAAGIGGIIGGGAWLAIGLANNRFYPYAVVVMLIGVVQLARGLLGLSEE